MSENSGNKINGIPMVIYWQKMPYELKVKHAANLVHDFYNNPEIGGNTYISVGGLDSIVLTLFIRSLGYTQEDVPAMSVSSLEHPGNQQVHKAIGVKPIPRGRDKNGEVWTLPKVYRECGYPIISKQYAHHAHMAKHPSDKNKNSSEEIRRRNEEDRKGEIEKGHWVRVFSKNLYEKGFKQDYDFEISDKCCKLMKEAPCKKWAKSEGRYPYLGLMADEGGPREMSLINNGCNYISEKTKRSCPFASFSRDDILRLALEMDAWYKEHWEELNPDFKVDSIIPSAYGEVVDYIGDDGKKHYKTTLAQRTGCTVCGFGTHILAKHRPHNFDLLRMENPKAWDVATKPVEEGGWGWGKVLDHFEIPWRDEPKINEQQNIFREIDEEIRSMKR